MKSIRRLFESVPIPPPFEGQGQQLNHNEYCVCKGTNKITITTYGDTMMPGGSAPVRGPKKVPCPYGYLKINQLNDVDQSDPDPDKGWDL